MHRLGSKNFYRPSATSSSRKWANTVRLHLSKKIP
jgi:hypothetical protein